MYFFEMQSLVSRVRRILSTPPPPKPKTRANDQREQVEQWQAAGFTLPEIVQAILKNRMPVHRPITRDQLLDVENSMNSKYRPLDPTHLKQQLQASAQRQRAKKQAQDQSLADVNGFDRLKECKVVVARYRGLSTPELLWG